MDMCQAVTGIRCEANANAVSGEHSRLFDPPGTKILKSHKRLGQCAMGLVGALLLTAIGSEAGRTAIAEVVEQRTQPFTATARALAPPPTYATGGTLRWDITLAVNAPVGCASAAHAEVLLSAPRLDLWRCSGAAARVLVGTRTDGTRWTRPLVHVSGTRRIDLHVGSARADSVTLGSLEVLDSVTGETRIPPPLRIIADTPPRPMPVFTVHGPASCPRDGGACYGYNTEGTHAGLIRIERDSRVSVLEKPQHKWLAPIVVSDLQQGAEGRTLLLAETWLFRGTNWVRFAIFDLARGKRVFEQIHGKGRKVSSPRIVPGPNGRAAFFYRDATGEQHVVINYRVRQ
jgi:hypothetical protein